MGNRLYLECYSGISGDMTVASLLDLGADANGLKEVLNNLNVDGFKIDITRVKKSGLDCCDFNVILDDEHENHDHDMEYLYGHEHSHDDHHHDDDHHHHQDGHHHVHRGFNDIKLIIDNSTLSENAKKIATRIFEIIAMAEAKAHGESFEKVHFHEVGAVDSIVDIIAIAYCIDNLSIDDVIVPYLCEGTGTVRCQHGILPVPVPAVVNISSMHDISIKITDVKGEMVTPTGAAVVAALKTSEVLPESFKIKKVGLGAGKRNYERAGILRAMIIE